MRDAVKATLVFLRHHMLPFLVFCLAAGGIFFTMVLLEYQAEGTFRADDQYNTYTMSRYSFALNQGVEQDVTTTIADLESSGLSPERIYISVDALIRTRADTTETLSLVSSYPDLPELNVDFFVDEGAADFTNPDNELMIGWEVYSLAGDVLNSMPNEQNGVRILQDGMPYKQFIRESMSSREIVGEIRVNESEPHILISTSYFGAYSPDCIIASFDHFFDLSDTCDAIRIQFESPLSLEQEDSFLSIVGRNLPVLSVEMPYQYDISTIDSYKESSKVNLVVVSVCLLGVFFLFQYLLRLRSNEISIARMVGATRMYIWLQTLILFLFSLVSSLLIGTALIGFLRVIPHVKDWFSELSFAHYQKSAILFVLLLAGCSIIHLIGMQIISRRAIKVDW